MLCRYIALIAHVDTITLPKNLTRRKLTIKYKHNIIIRKVQSPEMGSDYVILLSCYISVILTTVHFNICLL